MTPLSDEQASNVQRNPVSGVYPGGSNPRNFVKSGGSLYFSARDDFEDQEHRLFRMTSADALPENISLNPNGSDNEGLLYITGVDSCRVWLVADTDLHYLANDGITAIPMQVGEKIARARGITEFADGVVFTSQDENFDSWTFYARLDNPCSQPPAASLTSQMIINRIETTESSIVESKIKSRAYVRCDIRNNSQTKLENLRVSIRYQKQKRHSKKRRAQHCKLDVLAAGEATRCVMRVRTRRGKHRYTCTASAMMSDTGRVHAATSAYIKGVRNIKTRRKPIR